MIFHLDDSTKGDARHFEFSAKKWSYLEKGKTPTVDEWLTVIVHSWRDEGWGDVQATSRGCIQLCEAWWLVGWFKRLANIPTGDLEISDKEIDFMEPNFTIHVRADKSCEDSLSLLFTLSPSIGHDLSSEVQIGFIAPRQTLQAAATQWKRELEELLAESGVTAKDLGLSAEE